MKTTRYQFERDLESANRNNADWLKQSFTAILESEKHYTSKCDYIGYSILSIDEKVSVLDEQIKELQELKKRLKEAKEVALSIGAEVLGDYGIDKLEGAGISSITVSERKDKTELELIIHDEAALMEMGYYFKVLDSARVIEEFTKADERERLSPYCDVTANTVTTPPKLKINKRRSANTADFTTINTNTEVA